MVESQMLWVVLEVVLQEQKFFFVLLWLQDQSLIHVVLFWVQHVCVVSDIFTGIAQPHVSGDCLLANLDTPGFGLAVFSIPNAAVARHASSYHACRWSHTGHTLHAQVGLGLGLGVRVRG